MILKAYLGCIPFLLIGTFLVISGAVSKTLINETEMPATEEEKADAKPPTWVGRILVVGIGVASIIYGIHLWPR
jgi:hypothetical protein